MSAAIPQTSPEPDTDPIHRALARGSYREVIALCARRDGPSIGRLCMALLGSQAEADECAQEVFVAAYRALPNYRNEGSLRAFLFGIARRQCAKRLELRTRDERHLRLVYDAGALEHTPELSLETRQRAEHVRRALANLRPSERDAVAMRYQGGLDYRSIAEACGIDEAAARKRVSRGLVRMKELLTGVEG